MKKPDYFQSIAFLIFWAFLIFFSKEIYAQDEAKTVVKQLEFSSQNNLEITLSQKTPYKAFILKNPDRLVVDIENAQLEKAGLKPSLPGFISSSRTGAQKNSLRLVFDLKQQIKIEKSSFQKVKNQDFGKIIVKFEAIKTESLIAENNSGAENLSEEKVLIKTSKTNSTNGSQIYVVKNAKGNSSATYSLKKEKQTSLGQNSLGTILVNKTPVIVIDAGHGGKDPGTIGDYARTKEKNITLAYAKELKKSLENTKRYKVFLTRDDDFFVPLRKRVEKSRRWKADLFISLHANSISEPQTSGFSIYTLSEKSSDKQAELLAQKENRADIIAGVNFSGASPDIMKTLIDLSQRDSMNSSSRFANIVIGSVKKSEIKILQNTHRFAGFAVLTAPDVASTLIELGYLSNASEEKQLNNLIYKRRIVASLTDAIDEYFRKK